MTKVDKITQYIGKKFPSFGGGQGSNWNPIVNALKDEPLQFAAGVEIESVVRAVLRKAKGK